MNVTPLVFHNLTSYFLPKRKKYRSCLTRHNRIVNPRFESILSRAAIAMALRLIMPRRVKRLSFGRKSASCSCSGVRRSSARMSTLTNASSSISHHVVSKQSTLSTSLRRVKDRRCAWTSLPSFPSDHLSALRSFSGFFMA
jgi:hypothetical protein